MNIKNHKKRVSIALAILVALGTIGCGSGETKSFEANPSKGQYNLGEKLELKVKNYGTFDSLKVSFSEFNKTFNVGDIKEDKIILSLDSTIAFGKHKLITTLYKGGKESKIASKFDFYPSKEPLIRDIEIVKSLKRGRESYTQGYEFYNGNLYESSGLYGESFLRILEFPSLKEKKRIELDDKYFAEGITILNDNLYMITWKEQKAFVYDPKTLKKIKSFDYDGEGWGLTNDGTNLYMSNGSQYLYKRNPKDFSQISKVTVTTPKGVVGFINELEWIDGRIWANIYGAEIIVVINPENGVVEEIIRAVGILPKEQYNDKTDVFNGIAQNPKDKKIFVTGKLWPATFEVK